MPTAVGAASAAAPHNEALWREMAAYEHDGVCKRFAEENGVSIEEARGVFMEMKRFFYIAILSQQPCSPSKAVDAMWHTFLMYTAHYRWFCQQFNGAFIDHTPSDKPELEGYTRTREFALALFGEVDGKCWPDPSLRLAGGMYAGVAADCTCSNQGCSCNCSGNLGASAGLTLCQTDLPVVLN